MTTTATAGTDQGVVTTDTADGTVTVELFALDTEHCTPCRTAVDELDVAAARLRELPAVRSRRITTTVVRLTSAEHARRLGVVGSPTVRVAGHDVQLDVEEHPCGTCTELARTPVDCRTYLWEGERYDHPPADLVVAAVLRHLDENDVRSPDEDHAPHGDARAATGAPTSIDRFFSGADPVAARLAQLRAAVTGRVTTPDDADHQAAVSPWNLAVPVAPRIAVQAASAQDVVETVRFARRHGLTVTPQATGHGPIADLVGDIVVSTRGLDECEVHPEGWARVGAGVKWLAVVQAAAPYGLAPLSGSITDVGVVGYTTGGGLGPMARTYGLASDRVRAFELVTGDGVLRRVTPTVHSELYFGLRGGKGTLGIVTAVEFDLVHQPDFYGGALWFDGADAATVVQRWREWSATLPEAGTTSLALFRLPAMDGVPAPLAGRLTLSVRYVWTGDAVDGERHLAAMRAAAPMLVDDVRTKPYTEVDSVHTDPLDPLPAHEFAMLLGPLTDDGISALVDAAGPGSQSQQVLVEIRQLGGAYRRGGQHPSAFEPREASFSVLAVGFPGEATEHDHAVLQEALGPWELPLRLPNFSFTPEQLAAAYSPATRARLVAAMDMYDPEHVMAIGEALRTAGTR